MMLKGPTPALKLEPDGPTETIGVLILALIRLMSWACAFIKDADTGELKLVGSPGWGAV